MPNIRIGADLSEVIGQAGKAGEAFKNTGHHVKGIGEQWIHVNSHMATTLLRGTAIFEVFKAAGEAANKFAKTASEISKRSGSESLARSTAINRAGLGDVPGINELLRNAPGASSDQERTQAVEQLASFQEESRFTPSRKTVMRYISLINSGLFKADELLKLLKRNLPLPSDAEVAAKMAALTPEAREEIEMRNEERQTESEKQDTAADFGRRARRHDSNRELQALQHPGATFIPGLINAKTGGVSEAADRVLAATGATAAGNSFDTWFRGLFGIKPPPLKLNLTAHDPDRR